jgi:1-acyl-sn-glycerol-3-phosphate acyltransferase
MISILYINDELLRDKIMLIRVLYTIYTYVIMLGVLIIFIVPGCILLILPGKLRHSKPVYTCMQFFYWLIQKLSLLPIMYKGLDNLPKGPAVFVANHQSALDIPLLGLLTHGSPHIWLARKEVMNQFWLLRLVLPRVAIIVDTTSVRSAMTSLLSIIKIAQKENRHVMIFPEGGRFTSGVVQEFYGGFVLLVRKLGRPVIPVYIQGVDKVYPPHSWWAYPAPITVIVGVPMMPAPEEDDTQFKDRVYRWFLDHTR